MLRRTSYEWTRIEDRSTADLRSWGAGGGDWLGGGRQVSRGAKGWEKRSGLSGPSGLSGRSSMVTDLGAMPYPSQVCGSVFFAFFVLFCGYSDFCLICVHLRFVCLPFAPLWLCVRFFFVFFPFFARFLADPICIDLWREGQR